MSTQPTAFIVLFHDAPTAVATDLATAQADALADRTAPASAEPYENRWVEHSPTEWRLMTRRRDRGGRWSWTQRAIRAVPLLQGEQGPKGLKNPGPEAAEQCADRLETGRDHAAGDHQYCGLTWEVETPSDMLRNFIIAKGYPGTAEALDELLRRATATEDPAVL
ncbi:hypothetical protein [Streptomyces sp. MMS24-I29]|uniref:hypothetical protein n=1 Tax=Streptomyces sp. MMS24-I29 TaxID=3351480 RepID=UPI003C7E0167